MMANHAACHCLQTIFAHAVRHFSFHAVKLDDIVGQLRIIAGLPRNLVVDDATFRCWPRL